MDRRPPIPERPDTAADLTPDEIEQRQRPDGTVEAAGVADPGLDGPLTPDMVEQRQRADGTVEDTRDDPDGILSADVLEQRQVVETDDDEVDDRGGPVDDHGED